MVPTRIRYSLITKCLTKLLENHDMYAPSLKMSNHTILCIQIVLKSTKLWKIFPSEGSFSLSCHYHNSARLFFYHCISCLRFPLLLLKSKYIVSNHHAGCRTRNTNSSSSHSLFELCSNVSYLVIILVCPCTVCC